MYACQCRGCSMVSGNTRGPDDTFQFGRTEDDWKAEISRDIHNDRTHDGDERAEVVEVEAIVES